MPNEYFLARFCSLLLLAWKYSLRVDQFIEDHMPNEYCSLRLCSLFLLTWKQSLQDGQLIEHHMQNKYCLVLFCSPLCSLESKACELVSSSNITFQVNISQQASVHLCCSFVSKACEWVNSLNERGDCMLGNTSSKILFFICAYFETVMASFHCINFYIENKYL